MSGTTLTSLGGCPLASYFSKKGYSVQFAWLNSGSTTEWFSYHVTERTSSIALVCKAGCRAAIIIVHTVGNQSARTDLN
jgi:hypothetical protein